MKGDAAALLPPLPLGAGALLPAGALLALAAMGDAAGADPLTGVAEALAGAAEALAATDALAGAAAATEEAAAAAAVLAGGGTP